MAEMENMTKIIKNGKSKVLPLFTAALILTVSIARSETISLDLNSAISMAVENNESYLAAQKEVERAKSQIIEAGSGAFPQITGGLTYLKNWRVPIGVFQFDDEVVTVKFGTDNSYTADLTLTQPLYSGGRTFTALKIARLYKKLSQETVRLAGQDLKVEVFRSFFGAVLAKEVNLASKQSLQLAEENLRVVEQMFSQGVTSEYDLLRAKVEVANIQPKVIKSRTDSDVAISALKNLVGLTAVDELILNTDFDSTQFIIPPLEIPGFENELIAERPEIKISSYTTSGRQKAISLYKADYKPSLSFETSLQYQSQFDSGSPFNKKWDRSLSSLIVLSVPIFDSWKTPSRVKQAKIDYSQSKLREEAIRKAMILDLQQSHGRYLEARTNFSAQGDVAELAKRGLEIARVRFENGVGTQLELSDARLQLQIAKINSATAFYDLAISYSMLMRALGRELEPLR